MQDSPAPRFKQCFRKTSMRSLLTLRQETRYKLSKLAKSTGRSKHLLVEEALTNYCDLLTWQVEAVEEGLQDAEAGLFYSTQEIIAELEQKRASRLHLD